MRWIELKVVDHPYMDEIVVEMDKMGVAEEKRPAVIARSQFNYRFQLSAIVRAPMPNPEMPMMPVSMTADQMDVSNDILDKLHDAKDGDWIQLSNTEWKHMNEKVAKTGWPAADRRITDFVEYIANAPEKRGAEPANKPTRRRTATHTHAHEEGT